MSATTPQALGPVAVVKRFPFTISVVPVIFGAATLSAGGMIPTPVAKAANVVLGIGYLAFAVRWRQKHRRLFRRKAAKRWLRVERVFILTWLLIACAQLVLEQTILKVACVGTLVSAIIATAFAWRTGRRRPSIRRAPTTATLLIGSAVLSTTAVIAAPGTLPGKFVQSVAQALQGNAPQRGLDNTPPPGNSQTQPYVSPPGHSGPTLPSPTVDCPATPAPGAGAPLPQATILQSLVLKAGRNVAGCPDTAEQVPGQRTTWIVRGRCDGQLISVAITNGISGGLALGEVARRASELAAAGRLKNISRREDVGNGDLQIIRSVDGDEIWERRTKTDGVLQPDPMAPACMQFTTRAAPYSTIGPPLSAYWATLSLAQGALLEVRTQRLNPQRPTIQRHELRNHGTVFAVAECDTNTCRVQDRDGHPLDVTPIFEADVTTLSDLGR